MKKLAVIVDAFSTGARLPREFAARDIDCTHVQSSTRITPDFLASFSSSDFKRSFVVDTDLSMNRVAAELQSQGPLCVVAGTETGVEAAEQLAAMLGLSGNAPETSRLRRDKYQMHERLREVGLSRLRQQRCTSVTHAVEWAQGFGEWPIVLKPTASAGADGVTFCNDMQEVKQAADALLGKKNKLGEINEAVVVQERLTGQQYIVNAVSIDGRHYISEIWRDDKIQVEGASLVCDREVLLSPDSSIAHTLADYISRCLDALGVKNGPSHSELFMTDAGEPILIETAARMQGTIDHEAVIEATGHSHVTLTALRYANPAAFRELVGTRYQRKTNLHCITLCSRQEGIVVRNNCEERIGKLASFRSLIHTPAPGEIIVRTVDLFTNPGIVYLANSDESVLEREYRQIREWERAGELFSFN